MSRNLEVTAEQKKLIVELLDKFLPGCEAWAYGSRVKSKSNSKSDLDMVVFAGKAQRLQLADLREALEESNLPFRVDLFAWHDIPEQFQRNIKAEHVIIRESGR